MTMDNDIIYIYVVRGYATYNGTTLCGLKGAIQNPNKYSGNPNGVDDILAVTAYRLSNCIGCLEKKVEFFNSELKTIKYKIQGIKNELQK